MGPDQPYMQQVPQMPAPLPPPPGSRSKLPLVIGLAVGAVVLMLVIALAFGGGGEKKEEDQTPTNGPASSIVSEGAKSLDVQQVNDSISQDMSNLDNDRDFPADGLSDDTLGL